MVEILRHKLNCLEKHVQCRTCFEIPKGWIFQCNAGHIVCYACKQRIPVCPVCQRQWSEARNCLAELMCKEFDNMKLILINLEREMKKLSKNNGATVVTQRVIKPYISRAQNGAYPFPEEHFNCCIGSCSFSFPSRPLIEHVKNQHPNEFIELRLVDDLFEHTWIFQYTFPMTFDQAFRVAGMGTFFLKIQSSNFCNTIEGCVLMVHECPTGIEYRIEIDCCDEHRRGISMPQISSCRTVDPQVWWDEIATYEELRDILNHKKKLECTVVIQKKPSKRKLKKRQHNNENNISAGTRIDTVDSPAGFAVYRRVKPTEPPNILVAALCRTIQFFVVLYIRLRHYFGFHLC